MARVPHSTSCQTKRPANDAKQTPRITLDVPLARKRRTRAAGVKAGVNGLDAAARAADGLPAGEQPVTPHHHWNLLPS